MGVDRCNKNFWRTFFVRGAISVFIGMVISFIRSGQGFTCFSSVLVTVGYSLMIGYGLFGNRFVISFVEKR